MVKLVDVNDELKSLYIMKFGFTHNSENGCTCNVFLDKFLRRKNKAFSLKQYSLHLLLGNHIICNTTHHTFKQVINATTITIKQ